MKKSKKNYTYIIISFLFLISVDVFSQKEGALTIQNSESVKHIIAKKKAYNRSIKKVKGFKIQLFNGSENGAYRIRNEFAAAFPETPIKIEFFSPEWKVRVGNYKTRLEADRALLEIKETFSSAIIISNVKVKI